MKRAVLIILAAPLMSACGSQYDSVEDLREVVGCTEDFGEPEVDEGAETVGCVGADGRESFYLTVFDGSSDRDERLDYMRGLPKDGTAEAWMVYGDEWLIDCFTESVCESLADETGGELEQRR